MTPASKNIMDLHADQSGQASIEWVLLLVAVILPMVYLLNMLLDFMVDFYGMVVFIETLPFP